MRRLKRKNIKRFKRFKPQVFQALSFKTDPDFHQDDIFYNCLSDDPPAGGQNQITKS